MRSSKWNLFTPEMTKINKNYFTLRANQPANFFLFTALALCFFTESCLKENDIVGLHVLPKSDLLNVGFKDTTTLITYTVREDSVKTDGTSLNLIGSYNDPIFGKSSASVYTQLTLPSSTPSAVNFGTNLAFDSLVLILPYVDNFYGTLDAQTFKVYQLTQPLLIDSAYYSGQSALISPQPLASMNFVPAPVDSVLIGTLKYEPQLRIRLSDAFGRNILKQGGFVDNPTFQSFLQGLCIVPDNPTQASGTGAILYFNLTDPSAGMTLYYRNNTNSPGVGDTIAFTFSINNSCLHFDHFSHDYSTARSDLAKQISGADLTQGKNLTYVQSMSGLKTKITFPYIKNYAKDSTCSVNLAELILNIDPSSITGNYVPPPQLTLVREDATGKVYFIDDYFVGSTYFGGVYDPTNPYQYHFNIARYIQELMNGTLQDYGLYILVSGSAVNGNRLVLGGGGNSANKMRLRMSYTKSKIH